MDQEMQTPNCEAQGLRQNAKGVLRDMIKREEKYIQSLITLDRAINWELLSREDEAAIWHFLTTRR